ncbi:MAG: AAA family ATPase [Gemmatimonadetes bacterium]|jgi:ABC-type lipoprotein export system ATPase subunit|nr:AAA family ATPase [Gemmatimonadota bacterium]MBA4157047.1 AAA family ATPase [Gemmatimonadota bacterium]
MTVTWDWPGARWWKADLHVHSPGSHDFKDTSATAADWVDAAVAAGLHVVAITDHNSGSYIREVKQAATSAGVPLVIFPGVELTVGNTHLLGLFDPQHDGDAVKALLGACKIPSTQWGERDACATCSHEDALANIAHQGGIAIAAHVDDVKGIVEELGPGQALKKVLTNEHLHAVEVKDLTSAGVEYVNCRTAGYGPDHRPLAIVTSSDAHRLSRMGTRFTWLKMTRPTIDGLRLALQDPEFSVLHDQAAPEDPNTHAALVIESLEVRNGQYMGRLQPFEVRFNPWLNAIIGGRGTGKSTLLEFIRVALRREDEVPAALKKDFQELMRVPPGRGDKGALTPNTELRVLFRKDGARFRIGWSTDGSLPPIEQEQPDGTWAPAPGDVAARFPIRIYSQKQIFELARDAGALLGVVNDAAAVGYASWREGYAEEEARFLSLRAKAREIEAGLADEPRLRGELDDVVRKLAVFEAAGHSDILREYQLRQRQQRALDAWQEELERPGDALRETADALLPPELETAFREEDTTEAEVLQRVADTEAELGDIRSVLLELSDRADSVAAAARQQIEATAWAQAVAAATTAYQELTRQLEAEGAGDPSEYGRLVQNRQLLERRLSELEGRRATLASVRDQANTSLARLRELRREITARRAEFLGKVLEGNQHVRIEAVPYGDENLETELRRLIQCEGDSFQNDCGDLVRHLRRADSSAFRMTLEEKADAFESRLQEVKEHILAVAAGRPTKLEVRDRRFATRLATLKPEALDRAAAWFPEDSLQVSHSPGRNGSRFQPLGRGSPGQKTAALLAFLLSYGEEPMLLDQPEDDLDNHLIYDLIVRELRNVKQRRQIIIVTHNPNIVVNGDAELTIALDTKAGQTVIEQMGGLQEPEVREVICQVMEGGPAAFDLRYRRIRGGGTRV